jgi:hypothetical protein
MTPSIKPDRSIQYPEQTIVRAERAMRCSPFTLNFFAKMIWQSVPLNETAGNSGLRNQYTCKPLSELTAENELLWLIQVGLLRREVDGQGLTDSFRVTPLGRQLVQKWQDQSGNGRYVPVLRDRIYNALSRWLRLPF